MLGSNRRRPHQLAALGLLSAGDLFQSKKAILRLEDFAKRCKSHSPVGTSSILGSIRRSCGVTAKSGQRRHRQHPRAQVAAAADFPCDGAALGPLFAASGDSHLGLGLTDLSGLTDRLSRSAILDAKRLSFSGGPSAAGIPSGGSAGTLIPSVDGPLPKIGDTSDWPGLPKPTQPKFDFPKVIAPRIGPVIALSPPPKLILDTRTSLTLGNLLKRDPRVEQQSDPEVATDEVKRQNVLNLSSAEKARLAGSTQCSAAFNLLVTTFESNRALMGFWTEPERTVADFIPWYYQSNLTQENRDKAAPVIRAQERYQRACLEARIPPELNASLVQRAVGLLMYGDKVFCTALRTSASEVLTAKHCFQDANTGKSSDDVNAVLNNKGQMWFSYEAEPGNRFGVCKASLPKAGARFGPESDHVRLQISSTNVPTAPLKWVTTPIKTGTSLYLRGYFPFTGAAATSTDRLRSTAAGGCYAHSASERCFFHVCQTTPIMSGSPIFTRPEPGSQATTLSIAGIHLGSALLSDPNGVNGSVCSGIDGTKVPSSNFGYQP